MQTYHINNVQILLVSQLSHQYLLRNIISFIRRIFRLLFALPFDFSNDSRRIRSIRIRIGINAIQVLFFRVIPRRIQFIRFGRTVVPICCIKRDVGQVAVNLGIWSRGGEKRIVVLGNEAVVGVLIIV